MGVEIGKKYTWVSVAGDKDPRNGQTVTIAAPKNDDERKALELWRMMFNQPDAEIGVFADGTDFPVSGSALTEVTA